MLERKVFNGENLRQKVVNIYGIAFGNFFLEKPFTARLGLCHICEISVLVSKATLVSFISSLLLTIGLTLIKSSKHYRVKYVSFLLIRYFLTQK